MAGIYIHIPFCQSRCAYCDFYSTTGVKQRKAYVDALCVELQQRCKELPDEQVRTIYWGGGTPSLLDQADFQQVFDVLDACYDLQQVEEVTLEANPDDLSPDYLSMLAALPFNRISIGIQTFHEPTLRLLGRRHTAEQALRAVNQARQAGFYNISIDLMYGLPGQTAAMWEDDLRQAIALHPEHISAYHLTFEPGTVLYRLWQQGKITQIGEDDSLEYFRLLAARLKDAGYQHYEISNFCLPGKASRHNSSYWEGIPYWGCGASAHSYDGHNRRWNVSDISLYIIGVKQGGAYYETELLDANSRYNDYIITSLRTSHGTDLGYIRSTFGVSFAEYCLQHAQSFITSGNLSLSEQTLRLTEQGIFVSDAVMRELIYVD